jgi:predicted phage terminase large subunit-like protein
MWRYYEPSAIDAAEQGDTTKLPKFTSIVCSWDTTFKDKNTSDYVAGGAWGIHGGTRFLLRSFHEKASLSRTATQMIEMRNWCLQRWPHLPVKVLIEKSANGVEIINLLKRDIPGVIPIVVSTDKMTRAEACEPDFSSESVWVPGEANVAGNDYNPAHTPQWVQEIVEESSSFPRAANDDLVDMVTMALNYVRTTRRSPARTASALRGAARQRRREGALAFRSRR